MITEGSILSKVPPHSVEAEESFLGTLLQSNEALSLALTHVHEDDFYVERNRLLYKAIINMSNASIPVDVETVFRYLVENNLAEKIIGNDVSYLMRLVDVTPITRNAEYYADIVANKALLRSLIKACGTIETMCYSSREEDVSSRDIADEAERLLFEVTKRRLDNQFASIKDLLSNVLEQIEARKRTKGNITGVPSWYTKLDDITNGFQPGDLVILAARPSMGKTSFALNIAENVATARSTSNFGVGIFSLEMGKEQIAERLISSNSEVSLSKIRKGEVSNHDWVKIGTSLDRLSNSNILIDDSNPLTIMEIKGKARQMDTKFREKAKMTGKDIRLRMVIIDYLQLMSGAAMKRNASREQEVAEISRGLKSLAKELQVPVIALSQLSREVEKRVNKRPQLSDLRESGAIEQDADLVMFLHRDDYFQAQESGAGENEEREENNKAEVIIAKHRNGSLGSVELLFLKELTRFGNLTHLEYEGVAQ